MMTLFIKQLWVTFHARYSASVDETLRDEESAPEQRSLRQTFLDAPLVTNWQDLNAMPVFGVPYGRPYIPASFLLTARLPLACRLFPHPDQRQIRRHRFSDQPSW